MSEQEQQSSETPATYVDFDLAWHMAQELDGWMQEATELCEKHDRLIFEGRTILAAAKEVEIRECLVKANRCAMEAQDEFTAERETSLLEDISGKKVPWTDQDARKYAGCSLDEWNSWDFPKRFWALNRHSLGYATIKDVPNTFPFHYYDGEHDDNLPSMPGLDTETINTKNFLARIAIDESAEGLPLAA